MKVMWIWDIDGSCIDSSHRDHLFDTDIEKCWSTEEMAKDTQMAWLKGADLWRDGKFRYGAYAYLTARHLSVQANTEATLCKYGMLSACAPLHMKDTPREGFYGHERNTHFKVRRLLEFAYLDPDMTFVMIEDHEKILDFILRLEHPRILAFSSTLYGDTYGGSQSDRLARRAEKLDVTPAW